MKATAAAGAVEEESACAPTRHCGSGKQLIVWGGQL